MRGKYPRKRNSKIFTALGVVLVFTLLGSALAAGGVTVPTIEQFEALDVRITELEARVGALEAPIPTPSPSPSPEPSPVPSPEPSPAPSPEPSPAPSPAPSPLPIDLVPGAIVGVATGGIGQSAIEQFLGVRFLGIRRNASIYNPIPSRADLADQAAGYFVYRNAGSLNIDGGWAGIAAGSADGYLAAAVPLIVANFTPERPYLFSFHHEQNVTHGVQCGIGCNGTAADYKAAFIHVVDYFRAAGVGDRMRFVLTAGISQYFRNTATTGISVVDPGPGYVDIYGVDSYTYAKADGTLTKAHPLLNLVSAYAKARGRQYMVGEWGVADNAAGALYWREAVAQIESQGLSGPGSLYALLSDVESFGAANIQTIKDTMVGNVQFRWR